MPSLSETRIYVDEKDDDRKKRPLSEGDMPSKMPLYIRKGVQVGLQKSFEAYDMTLYYIDMNVLLENTAFIKLLLN